MTGEQSSVRLDVAGTQHRLAVHPERLIVAGYTGRDQQAVAEHIAELAAIGVPEPVSVPAFYELDPALLTTESVVSVDGPATSGEVEPVLIRHDGAYYLAVGSDHTDRDRERGDIAGSKAACPKPLGQMVLSLGEDLALPDYDASTASSSVDEVAYQQGTLAMLRRPDDLLRHLQATLGDPGGDLVVFGGTWPLSREEFVYGRCWHVRLELADGRTLNHSYEVKRRSL